MPGSPFKGRYVAIFYMENSNIILDFSMFIDFFVSLTWGFAS